MIRCKTCNESFNNLLNLGVHYGNHPDHRPSYQAAASKRDLARRNKKRDKGGRKLPWPTTCKVCMLALENVHKARKHYAQYPDHQLRRKSAARPTVTQPEWDINLCPHCGFPIGKLRLMTGK